MKTCGYLLRPCAARAGSCADPAGGHAQCREYGQPERENDGKRGAHGYDAGKKVNGRKRHIVVDTVGLLLAVFVHAADIRDRDGGAQAFLWRLRGRDAEVQGFEALPHRWVAIAA